MKKKNSKFLIWGYYGSQNFGDELMLEIISRKIREASPDALIYAKCGSDPEISGIFPIVFKKRGCCPFFSQAAFFLNLPAIILKIDSLVIGGGTLFLDKGKHNLSMMAMFVSVLLCKLFSKKIYVIGAGIESLACKINIFYLKFILRNSRFVCVRDNFSFEAAKKITGGKNLKKGADIVFDSKIKELILKPDSKKEYIILSLYDYGMMWGGKEKGDMFFQHSKKLLLDILENWGSKYKIILCAFQRGEGGYDYEFLKNLSAGALKDRPDFSDKMAIEYINSTEKAKKYFNGALFAVSSRYHALVLCAILKVPFLGIKAEEKISEICREFDMPFINENEYLQKGLFAGELKNLAGFSINEKKSAENMKLSAINFEWLNEKKD